MKHIMVFNDNSEDDRDTLKRMQGARDLCLALWAIDEALRKIRNRTYVEWLDLVDPDIKGIKTEELVDTIIESAVTDLREIMAEHDVYKTLEGL